MSKTTRTALGARLRTIAAAAGLLLGSGCGGETTERGGEPEPTTTPDLGSGGTCTGPSCAQQAGAAGSPTASELVSRAELCRDGGTLVAIEIDPPTYCDMHGYGCGTPCEPCWHASGECVHHAGPYRCDKYGLCVATRD